MSIIDDAYRINDNYRTYTFSTTEIRDIAIAIIALTISTTLIFHKNKIFSNDVTINVLCWTGVSFIIVILSFMLHELGHKFTAQRYGVWAEFRMFPMGLLFGILSSCAGLLFAAPGAVYINGILTKEMNGKISAAGPVVNIVIGCVATILCMISFIETLAVVLYSVAIINAFLAFFNLIPIPPLDGSKVLKWNVQIYIVMIVTAAALLFFLKHCI